MARTLRSLAVALAISSIAFTAGSSVRGAELVAVETRDGRALSGVVDSRSDEQTLWLRREETAIVLRVPIAWDDLSTANVDGTAIYVADLRERREELASAGATQLIPEVEVGTAGAGAKPQALGGTSYWPVSGRMVRVRNLDIVQARLVNLDRDVAPDGLQVSIVAIGDDGAPVAVRGSLRAELFGERRSLSRERREDLDFDELGRWSERVQAEDFVNGMASYCLPFRTTAPEWEFDLMPDAVLTVQLGASGHGNFSASVPVVLRKFNPLRDDLQQYQGTRFLPNEVVGWRPQGPFGAQQGRWLWWGR
jgi:hypothetical protein